MALTHKLFLIVKALVIDAISASAIMLLGHKLTS
jgi:hypothetical protein